MNTTTTLDQTTTQLASLAPMPEHQLAVLGPEIAQKITVNPQDPAQLAQIEEAKSKINMHESSSILYFGTQAQSQLNDISEKMLSGVKNKDLGVAGDSLGEMVTTIRGFDSNMLDPTQKVSWWQKLLGKAKPLAKFMSQYEEVKTQLDRITSELERHNQMLLTDVVTLDKLYNANLDFYRQLEIYIAAGEKKLQEVDQIEIPAFEATAQASGDMLDAQKLRDLRASRDDLERRVHDLKLTRQVAMQSLPSIRLVQENDKSLINKINSTLTNTVPLWKNQLAQAITIFRMQSSADLVKKAGDLTNDLLEKNAENLKLGNAETRKQIERGVYDIESIKKANQSLIATIDESVKIAEEGKSKRALAETELVQLEANLKQALIKAKTSL